MPAFSINLIVRDSAKILSECLNSLQDLSDDTVVVVDSRTQDDTKNIAGKYSKNFFIHPFVDFASQRNFAVSKSVHDWIFSLDADEVVSPALYKYLKEFSDISTSVAAFSIKRTNIIFGKEISHTNWDPNGIVRLFSKHQGTWTGSVHEVWQTSGQTGDVKFPIIHQNYRTVEEFMTKLDTYTTIEAAKINKFSLINFCCLPKKEFIRRYFLHAGFLDGYHGLYLSFLMWFYQVSVWVKVWQKEHITS